MKLATVDLKRVFAECFFVRHRTVLTGGGAEPLYLPSDDGSHHPHRIIYRADYFASALHEVAHWCLAGAERRTREDYGYWYCPDGRSGEEQAAFELVEARPQALESIFSEACEFEFHLSADNLTLGIESSVRFESEVELQMKEFIAAGLSGRAAVYQEALARLTRARRNQCPGDLKLSVPADDPA